MKLAIVVLCVAAVCVSTASATAYTWSTSCTGDYTYGPGVSTCFMPNGIPTLQDTVTFGDGTVVSFNSGVGYDPYNALMAQSVDIQQGAQVTFFNGMIGVSGNVQVDGVLVMNGDAIGVGPFDDGYNLPLPDYSMPGFTPTIIGSKDHFSATPSDNGVQSVLFVTGTIVMIGNYPSVFIDVSVSETGNITAPQNAYFFGVVNNSGIMNIESLYVAGTLNNEVAGRATFASIWCSPLSDWNFPTINNNGHMYHNNYYQDQIRMKLNNYGVYELREDVRGPSRSASQLGEVVFQGGLQNKGKMLLASQRHRNNRFKIDGPVRNKGIVEVRNAGFTLGGATTNEGSMHLRSQHHDEDWFTFSHDYENAGVLDIQGAGVTFGGSFVNSKDATIRSKHVSFVKEVRNSARLHVLPLGANKVEISADATNGGDLQVGGAHVVFKGDVFNDGHMRLYANEPRKSVSFIEGTTYSTGNLSVHNTHLTVTGLVHHGSSIHLETAASTVTLGAWGSSLQRGIARGYLQKEHTSQCASAMGPQDASCTGASSCDACCSESKTCMVYLENVYCGGYSLDDYSFRDKQVRYVLAQPLTDKMPLKMKSVLHHAKLQHQHVFTGDVRVFGPGAITTTETVEVQGTLRVEEGAEWFSMVEHSKDVVAGPGHIAISNCGKWFLGNDAVQSAQATPTISVADGGHIVVPKHATVHLRSGTLSFAPGSTLHVDGKLSKSSHMLWNSHSAFRLHGHGELSDKE